jgi:diadenosine tetraphosphate (Ap4A) HIT family hydrolase
LRLYNHVLRGAPRAPGRKPSEHSHAGPNPNIPSDNQPHGAVVSATTCTECEVLEGARPVAGGILHREGGLAIHLLSDPSPLPGWLVLTSERHARGWYDLPAAELAALGPLAARVMAAQRRALGAEHVYAFAIGDVLLHFHLHLVPRFPDTPDRLRGRRCFEARPEDLRPQGELVAAGQRVIAALRG